MSKSKKPKPKPKSEKAKAKTVKPKTKVVKSKVKKAKSVIKTPIEAPVVEAPIETPADLPVVEASAVEAVPATVKKPKPKKEVLASGFHFDPPETTWEPRPVDAGWRGYRLWTRYELEWDEADDDPAKMKSIRKSLAKTKVKLIEELVAIPKESLVVKTDLATDEHPFEPFIEVWVDRKTEDDIREQLHEMASISVIDPELGWEPVATEPKPTTTAPKTTKAKKAKTKASDKEEESA